MLRAPRIFDVIRGETSFRNTNHLVRYDDKDGEAFATLESDDESHDGGFSRYYATTCRNSYIERNGETFVSKSRVVTLTDFGSATAISNHVMRAGRHYAEFDGIMGGTFFGVVRPLKGEYDGHFYHDHFADLLSERTPRWGESNVHHCQYICNTKECEWTDWVLFPSKSEEDWEGKEEVKNGPIGLLLDLTEGTLTLCQDGRRLGVLKDGLGGEYCWIAKMSNKGNGVSIKKGSVPPSPST